MPDPRPQVDGVEVIDLNHDGLPGAICVYFLPRPEPTLVDPGPSTSLEVLTAALGDRGVGLEDLRHVLLTHVHLDHAGAAGHLAMANPRVTVHVHEDGAPHMADPERLVASTRRTFGSAHDRLWGEVLPVPRSQLRGWRAGDPRPVPGLRPLGTPGHIAHHLAWEAERLGVLFTGDSLGIVLHSRGPSHPATPPPAVDLAAWRRTLTRVLAPVEADAFGCTHFGLHPDLHGRRLGLLQALNALALRVEHAMAEGEGAEEADAEAFHQETVALHGAYLSAERAVHYFENFSARTDWEGMRFHLARGGKAALA
jgi:glyoxylase-like metal-dependent hydrolase (beta-lactamase superfamily II)